MSTKLEKEAQAKLDKITYRVNKGLDLFNLEIDTLVSNIFSGYYLSSPDNVSLMRLTEIAENSEILNTNFPLWISFYKNRESMCVHLEVIVPIEEKQIETRLNDTFVYVTDSILDFECTNVGIDLDCSDRDKISDKIIECIKSLVVEISRINNLYVEIANLEKVE